MNDNIIVLTKEGLGIRSTARVLKISTTTLLRRMVLIAKSIKSPIISMNKSYEVHEMRSNVKRRDKPIRIAYALDWQAKVVVGFSVDKRTNRTLRCLIRTLELSNARIIYTDGLRNYKYIIPPVLHTIRQFATNGIERRNLALRTRLKRLNRSNICFSRSLIMLNAVLKIYFWG